jgi:TonB family protein
METEIPEYDIASVETEQATTPVKVRSLGQARFDREMNAHYHSERRRTNTVLGSIASLVVLLGLLFLLNILDITPYQRREERVTIPIQLLQFGVIGSNEANKGNLSAEGKAAKDRTNPEPLADAAKTPPVQKPEARTSTRETPKELVKETVKTPFAPETKTLAAKPRETTPPSPVKPAENAASAKSANEQTSAASAKTAIGTAQGSTSTDAEGLGRFGSGAGRGQGYGLEWGGGGNRVVLHKELPKYPAGVNTSTQIKIRFTVQPSGMVGMIMPMQKGDPVLERAAIEALRRWQFNPMSDGKEMVGFITFTFRVQ